MRSAREINDHCCVAEFARADEAAEPYKWALALKDPLRIPGYGGQFKHFMTVRDASDALTEALHIAKGDGRE